jgi:exopolysaccharide biosynthesis predicted pyruvyltransferase EpsI
MRETGVAIGPRAASVANPGTIRRTLGVGLSNLEVIERCSAVLRDVIGPLIPKGGRVALVDYPHSLNSGDHAIWLGEKAFLASLGVEVAYECDATIYDRAEMAARIGDGVILLHGGGNFGDLYPLYNEFRLRVLADFPDNRVVLLPQQATFLSNAYLNRTRALIARHRRVTLIARDLVTHHLMVKQFGDHAQILMAPDMAFALGPQARVCPPAYDIVWIARIDTERANANDPETASGLTGKAPSLIKPAGFADGLAMNFMAKRRPGEVMITDWYLLQISKETTHVLNRIAGDRMSAAYLSRALTLLSLGRLVITDRLHAHILCLLLGIPHILLNNIMGKNWNFYEAWTRDSPLCRLATDAAQAWALARATIEALPDRQAEVGDWPQEPEPAKRGDLPWEPAN